jgi:hypothetical protein
LHLQPRERGINDRNEAHNSIFLPLGPSSCRVGVPPLSAAIKEEASLSITETRLWSVIANRFSP